MKNLIRLIGPTVMIFIGLQLAGNVVLTFLLFYSWLLAVPLLDHTFPKGSMKVTRQALVLGTGSGLLFFIFIFGGLNWLHVYLLDIDALRVLLLEWGFSGPGEIGLVLVLMILNPVLEEFYWRGYMFDKLRKERGAGYTIVMTALFYTLYHILSVIHLFQEGYAMVAVLPVLIAGLFWGYIREKTAAISATVIGHGLADLGIVCVYWFIVR
ncbi:CPBP family intramembrane glutamic endopeptidase [Planococcus salinus]|uniref:CPBP family intramembrane metalloprotease n=1 Tax=Planococcus salinus TaxID=1848460 RepID=A0A3M8P5P5_9BACL|nr:CPBP family intramembrane glutamic endopeptidase [Planococcus salinus]RNF38999.1 CPBP family intramembrane metalloprotease [Planococcus salinus]